MTHKPPLTAEELWNQRWYAVPDDEVGGWAVANVNKPTGQIDPMSTRERVLLGFITWEEHAKWLVELHNRSLARRVTDDAPRVRRPTVHQRYGGLSHVCDYVETDGTTSGACHLIGPHLGRCDRCVVEVGRTVAGEPITVAATATDCVHQATWELSLLCPYLDCEVHR